MMIVTIYLSKIMDTKVCIRCGQEKQISEYYTHPRMKDGHLNKCKKCCKSDAASNYKIKSKNTWFVESERRRGREKYKRLNYKTKYHNNPIKSFSDTKNLHRNLINAGFDMAMKEAHHWNYNFPRQGFILSRKVHKMIHRNLSFNKETKCFMTGGKILLTFEDHREYINNTLKTSNIQETVIEFNLGTS